jgi:hypothetical protein
MTRRKIAFGWYGGKYSHLDWLLPLLPKAQHYCEPFRGSAAVLLNREPAPVETYNDLDGEVVNFFRVLRNQKEELLYAIGMTPFSREEFLEAIPNRSIPRAQTGLGPASVVRTTSVEICLVAIGGLFSYLLWGIGPILLPGNYYISLNWGSELLMLLPLSSHLPFLPLERSN